MTRFSFGLAAATLAAAGLWLQLGTASADDKGADKCGDKGQPSCPLQGWMEENTQKPLEAKELDKVAAALEKAAGFAPNPKWNEGDKGWKKIAEEGAKAAKAGDMAATKASCKSCHKTWRKKYKAEFRTKPVPK